MKTNYIKCSLWLVAMVFAAVPAKAQTSVSGKTAYNNGGYNSYDRIHSENGKQVEQIQSNIDDKFYKIELINDKMTELYVDGVKIPADNWYKYSDAIAAIKEQIRKNKEQALRNEEQARLNQVQDKKNEEQAKRNEEQANLNQIRDKKNEEQARLNEIQAKKNEAQAKENERMMKEMIADLVNDKIIPDAGSLFDLTLNSDEMIVNGVKQPDGVFKKYREKYNRSSKGSFSYKN